MAGVRRGEEGRRGVRRGVWSRLNAPGVVSSVSLAPRACWRAERGATDGLPRFHGHPKTKGRGQWKGPIENRKRACQNSVTAQGPRMNSTDQRRTAAPINAARRDRSSLACGLLDKAWLDSSTNLIVDLALLPSCPPASLTLLRLLLCVVPPPNPAHADICT